MDIGVALPQFDYTSAAEDPPPWEITAAWARRAEELGFASVWLADHLFLSTDFRYGGPPGRHRALDPVVALAAVARRTARVRIGTLVLCAHLRPPGVLAKALSTLDILSAGRLTVGLGAGWFKPEYDEAGIPFERIGVRLAQLAEATEIVKAVLGARGDPVTFAGEHYSVDGARCRPPSVQHPRPQVWIGGKGDRLLDVVARHADGWNTVWVWTPEGYLERMETLDRACERIGRDPATVARTLGLTTLVGEDEADLRRRFEVLRASAPTGVFPPDLDLDGLRSGRLVGTVEQVREQLEGWRALGVSTFIAGLGALPFAVSDAAGDLEMVASALP
jgi:probable F420-dependent oxidoreductase